MTLANAFLLYPFFFLFFVYLVIKFNKPKYKNLPPSPSKLPFIGNLHQVQGSPHHIFRALAQKHGPLMLLQLGNVQTLVVSSADLAQDVMKTYDHVFSSRPVLTFPKRLSYDKDIAFAPYGDYWRQVRKVCSIQLLNAKRVHSFRSLREEEIDLVMQKIEEAAFKNVEVNLSLLSISFTNDNVCRVALGRKYNEGERGKKFKSIMKEFTFLLGVPNIGDLIPSLAWVNYLNGLNARLEKNFNDIDSFLDEVIEEHIEKKKVMIDDNDGCENEEDFVDVMLRIEKDCTLGFPFARDSTKAIILDMFAAGTDTSSVSLDWAMSELLREPEIMEEVQKEVRAIAGGKLLLKDHDIEEMHYLKAVIKETIRLHPPLPLLVPRESMEYINLHGYDIPAKTRVMINAYAIARDPLSWEEPEKFWPKRFLQDGSSASVDFKGCDFQFIPFGAGRRGCPGMTFAMSVVELALANLLNRFNWSLPKGMDAKYLNMEEGAGITAYRKNELVLIAKPHY
ncbi:hypothetical protein AQUCO_05600070v1 [Aquilegia coerulea]|uniref:Cytochrome P450 n=1 Tax=Aquilegia coerulea TaxID=218851 RepID=A0A2G5CGI4_AQUCA|nr:hypothetical protein AQUCO_05600070v1 [Aquilegia coerulea]